MQVMGTVSAMQAARHDKLHRTGSIAARPCKERKDGAPTAPTVPERERKIRKAGPPAAVHQPPAKPASWWSKYTTQLSCEFSVGIADLSDQEDYFKGSGAVLAAGLAGNSLTLGLAGDALVGLALIPDALHARSICVPLAWGN